MVAAIDVLLNGLFSFYNTVFQPVLAAGPYVALGFFSACLAGLFSLIYWYLLDIDKADKIKDKLSEHQDKMKEARSNDNSDKASEHMQKTMKLNQRLMKLNIKPMIATMVFVALVFPWLGNTYSPAIDMNTTGNNTFEGQLVYAGQPHTVTVENNSEISVSAESQTVKIGGDISIAGIQWEPVRFQETENGGKLKMAAEFVELPISLPFAGDELNWLGFYILIAMPLTYIFRKVLGVA